MKLLNRNPSKGQGGFTLVEVILSIAILSIVSVVVLKLFILSSDLNERSKESDLANLTALNMLETLRLEDQLDSLLTKHSFLEPSGKAYQGRLFLDAMFNETSLEASYELEVRLIPLDDLVGFYDIFIEVYDLDNNKSLAAYETGQYFTPKEATTYE